MKFDWLPQAFSQRGQ